MNPCNISNLSCSAACLTICAWSKQFRLQLGHVDAEAAHRSSSGTRCSEAQQTSAHQTAGSLPAASHWAYSFTGLSEAVQSTIIRWQCFAFFMCEVNFARSGSSPCRLCGQSVALQPGQWHCDQAVAIDKAIYKP